MQGVDLSQQAQLELREQGLGLLFIDQIRPSRKLNNATYVELDIVREQNRLARISRENGCVYAKIHFNSYPKYEKGGNRGLFSKDKIVVFDIILGQRPTIKEIVVEGEKTVAKNVVKREITLKKDQHYSESARRNSLTQLYAHPLFDQAEIKISEQSDTASLILDVRVTEEEMRSFQWRIGAGYFDRLERPIRIFDGYQLFRTQLSWVHRNLGGGGQQFTAGLKLSYFERYIEADYLFPLFSIRIVVFGFTHSVSIETNVHTISVQPALGRHLVIRSIID